MEQCIPIVKALLQLPRIQGPGSMKGPHDKYTAHLRDVLDPLYIELSSLRRHYLHHRELEAAASTHQWLLGLHLDVLPDLCHPLDSSDEAQPETKTEGADVAALIDAVTPAPAEPALELAPAVEPPTVEPPVVETATAVEANGSADNKDDTPSVFKEVPTSDDLEYAISRVATHAKLILNSINVHITSGIARFRVAAQCILDGVQDHHRRYSWDVLRRRRDFRKTYVSALAQKLVTDEATRIWSEAPPGSDKIQEKHELLEKEVAVMDKRFWTSLARWEYRKTVVHLCVVFLF